MYYSRDSEERKSRELELLQNTFSGIDESYSWQQVKKLLQDSVFPWCQKFGTWSSSKKRVDPVPNRKVSLQKEESSVLGPQNIRRSRPSPEQESTNIEHSNSFSAWSLESKESRPSPEWESTNVETKKNSAVSAVTPL